MAQIFGSSREMYEKRLVLQDGETEVSGRLYNIVFGGTIAWGFLLNALLIYFFSEPVYRFVAYTRGGAIMLLVGYLVLAFLGAFLVANPGRSVMTGFLGFTLIAAPVGLLLCVYLHGMEGGLVYRAVVMTIGVALIMMGVSTLKPELFLSMGRALGVALVCSLIASLFSGLIWGFGSILYDWIILVIMSLYIGFDWARATHCARTLNNAVGMAASLYLDLINVFIRILAILSKSKDR